MPNNLPLTSDETATAYQSSLDPGLDFLAQVPFEDLYEILIVHACHTVELALGRYYGRAAVSAVLRSLPLDGPPAADDAVAFEERVKQGDLSLLKEDIVRFDWQEIGAPFAHLFIYARHGNSQSIDPTESRTEIEDNIKHFQRLVADAGVRAIVTAGFEWFTDTLSAAEARWALDNGLSVAPDALAALAGVKAKTLANMVASGQLSTDADGRVSAAQAMQYLDRRKNFVRSVWQEPGDEVSPPDGGENEVLTEQIFVPIDGDGGAFLPTMARRGRDGQPRYIIGDKTAPRYVDDYWDALAELGKMVAPRWRRPPTGKGGWSLVTAQEGWRRFTRTDLQRMVDALSV